MMQKILLFKNIYLYPAKRQLAENLNYLILTNVNVYIVKQMYLLDDPDIEKLQFYFFHIQISTMIY